MITIHWIIGQNKTCYFFSYILKKLLLNNDFYKKHPELNPYIYIPNREEKIKSLIESLEKIPPSGFHFGKKLEKKYKVIEENLAPREYLVKLWEPFTVDYFTCDEKGLQRVVNSLKLNLKNFSEQIHIIPYENGCYFLDWYIKEKLDKILTDIFIDFENKKQNLEQDKGIKFYTPDDLKDELEEEPTVNNYKVYQRIWFVGEAFDFVRTFDSRIEFIEVESVNIFLVQENIYKQKNDYLAKFTKKERIKKIELDENYKYLYEIWTSEPQKFEEYINELKATNKIESEVLHITYFIRWQELKYSIMRQIEELLL